MADNTIITTQDGSRSLRSGRFGASYHSRYGAVQESRHVFIEAGLHPLLATRQELDVLEIGFGSGLNALLTLRACEKKGCSLTYTAMEAFPITLEEAEQMNYHEWMDDLPDARERFLDLHRAPWDQGIDVTDHFHLRKWKRPFDRLRAEDAFDLVYFDPFSPETQPEAWEEDFLARVYAALRPAGRLVTYCAKGVVKRRMKALGFRVEALKGPPGKREMTRAVKEAASR